MIKNKNLIVFLLSLMLVFSTLMVVSTNAYSATKKVNSVEKVNTSINNNDLAKDVFDKINQLRKRKGLEEYTWNDQIACIADERAKNIATSFSHVLPNGKGYESLYENAGIVYSELGENIAYGFTTADAVVNGWQKHTVHRDMLYSRSFTDCTIGIYISPEGKVYYVAEFMAK